MVYKASMTPSKYAKRAPRVSVGLPVFNGEKYLRQALDSLLDQSFEDFELIIADNASNDGTREICESYAVRDPRVRYFRNPSNIGAAPNFNRVFELAQGEYFRWAAHDDICSPRVLERCVEVLNGDRTVVLCHPHAVAVDEQGQVIDGYMEKYDLLKEANSPIPAKRFYDFTNRRHACFQVFGLIRASALGETPRIGSYAGSDRVLLAELALKGPIVEIAEPLYVRRHREQYCALESSDLRTSWYDPNAKSDANLADFRTLREYAGAIKRSQPEWKTRLSCYLVLARWVLRRRKRLSSGLLYLLAQKKKVTMSAAATNRARSDK